MSDSEFKPGDVVRLKSGGPKMTVLSLAHSQQANCSWFSGSECKTNTFSLAALKRATDGGEET